MIFGVEDYVVCRLCISLVWTSQMPAPVLLAAISELFKYYKTAVLNAMNSQMVDKQGAGN